MGDCWPLTTVVQRRVYTLYARCTHFAAGVPQQCTVQQKKSRCERILYMYIYIYIFYTFIYPFIIRVVEFQERKKKRKSLLHVVNS